MGLTVHRVARDTGLPVTCLREIVHERRGVSAETTIAFGAYFDQTPEFRVNAQKAHEPCQPDSQGAVQDVQLGRWGLRANGANPRRFVKKYKERKRERFLTEDEFRRLGQVLSEVEGSETLSAVTAIRLPMLTGCRLGEIQTLRWENMDLEAGELRLPDSKTAARGWCRCRARRWVCSPPCFATQTTPGALPAGSRAPISPTFSTPGGASRRAGLGDVRIHDLGHSFASRMPALGESLPMVGKLLGHTQVQTTARYAHLARDSVKASASKITNSIGADILAGGAESDAT